MPATLTAIRIRNLALVERLEWELGPGFTAVTGETGAGKSVIVGALQLLVGERADRTVIRAGAEGCSVEGEFRVGDVAAWNSRLVELGLEACEEGVLLMRRTLAPEGPGRQFVNGTGTTLAVLRELGDLLVDLHGPHDHQSLFSAERQLDLLDAFAGVGADREAFRSIHAALGTLEREREALTGGGDALEREIALLRHQVAEVDAAGIDPGKEAELDARYALAANSRRLIELANSVVARLDDDDDSVSGRLAETQRLLRELERLDPAAAALGESHAVAVGGIEEVARALRDYAGALDLDPGQLASMEERINLIHGLRRKYGGAEGTIEAVIAAGAAASERLRRIEHRGEEIGRLDGEMARLGAALRKAGASLSAARAKAAPRLAKEARRHLADLGFRQAGFEVEVAAGGRARPSGFDAVEFQFAPNPGEPARPLRAIASSGEISRVMLALKTALADQDQVSLLVFDEIDANVGGEIAHAVGAKMAALGEGRQVVCITHLPQVAARAGSHFVVRKETIHGRTLSTLDPVRGGEREAEVARMLGGASKTSLALARSLLNGDGEGGQ